jgi:hypothetical protein
MKGGARKKKNETAKARIGAPPPVMVRAPIPVRTPYTVLLPGAKRARRVSKAQEQNKELRKTISDQKKLLKVFQKYVKDVKKPVKMTPCFV